MLTATLCLFGLGLLAAILLAVASKIFYVWEDPRIEQVEEALLGANCGGCGYPGCSAAAEAVVAGQVGADVCVAGGIEIARNVAAVMGLVVTEKEPEIAKPGCTYGVFDASLKYDYIGVPDCRAAAFLEGGSKECSIGCLGLGTCVRSCPFGALAMGENGLPVVNAERCTACGVCAQVCPKEIITVTSATKRMLSDLKTNECTAPCQRGCPAEIDIPEYIRRISAGRYLEAVAVIKEKNPFPLVCGWLCPAPCETECRRLLVDEPVTINALKKFVVEYERENGQRAIPGYLPPAAGKRIAIIGGGVEGLTAAYYLRRLGHNPKILEATGQLGGILRYVIAAERLPRTALDWDIEGILELGVDAETERMMGRDFTLSSLFDEAFDMVLLTTGGWDSRQVMLGNKDYLEVSRHLVLPGTLLLPDFLLQDKRDALALSYEGQRVVILGGGKSGILAAKRCVEKKAGEVTLVLPFDKKQAVATGLELPIEDETAFRVLYSTVAAEIRGSGDALKVISLVSQDGETRDVELDRLITGSGRFPEMLFTSAGAGEQDEKDWKTVPVLNVFPSEGSGGVFAGSEVSRPTDQTAVVTAVKRGRKMVRAMDLYLSGELIEPETVAINETNRGTLQNIHEIPGDEAATLEHPRTVVDNRLLLGEADAQVEAERCLSCGLICYKTKK